jgi:cold shock CspA family protein
MLATAGARAVNLAIRSAGMDVNEVDGDGFGYLIKPDKGYRAITSPDLPEGFDARVHFSAIEMSGYRSLNTGDAVEFD